MYETLKGEVAKYKQLKHLTYSDIGKMTGYRANTIAQFMSGARESSAVAAALDDLVHEKRSQSYEEK